MDSSHHRQPFIGCAFRRHAFADFVVENFRAAARQTVKARFLQTPHDRFVIQTGDQMQVMNLWRRKAVQLKARILRRQSAQQIFIPFNAKIRVQPALHQNARATQRNRLVNLLADFIDRANVSVGRAGPAIESAESADNIADIRVVYVAIDDVGDDVVRMTAPANLIRGRADPRDVVRFQQRGAVYRRWAVSTENFVQKRLNVRLAHALSLLTYRTILKVRTRRRWRNGQFDEPATISRLACHLRFTISELTSGYDRRKQKTHRHG